jgi:hypothetical protein
VFCAKELSLIGLAVRTLTLSASKVNSSAQRFSTTVHTLDKGLNLGRRWGSNGEPIHSASPRSAAARRLAHVMRDQLFQPQQRAKVCVHLWIIGLVSLLHVDKKASVTQAKGFDVFRARTHYAGAQVLL